MFWGPSSGESVLGYRECDCAASGEGGWIRVVTSAAKLIQLKFTLGGTWKRDSSQKKKEWAAHLQLCSKKEYSDHGP